MKRKAGLVAVVGMLGFATPAHATIDGQVAGLKADTFAVLNTIKQRIRNGPMQELDALELKGAIMRDGKIDDAERDLLEELTHNLFRGITVTQAGSSTVRVIVYPTIGPARQALQNTLSPPLNLEAKWAQGAAGWNEIVANYRKGAIEENRVVNFVSAKLGLDWAASNMGNSYKPLRDRIAQLYGYSGTPGVDTTNGRVILYKAMKKLDAEQSDRVPDFLYNWTRPLGFT